MAAKKELQVSAVENGTVIDHIPAEKLFDVINVLGIQNLENTVTFGYNLISSKLGKKGIIKIWNKFLKDDDGKNQYYKRFRSCGEKSGYGARTRGGNC